MLKTGLAVALLACFVAGPACGASLEKAKAFYQNNLLDDAKRELIDLLYGADAGQTEKPLALYMLGMINSRQGQSELAAANWRELIEKFPQSPEAQLARENLGHPEGVPEKHATTPPGKPVAVGPASSQVVVRPGTAADLSHPAKTEVPSLPESPPGSAGEAVEV